MALRLAPTNGGGPMTVRLALPPSDTAQQLGAVVVTGRGLAAAVVRDGPEPHVSLRGTVRRPRRVAVRYEVTRRRPAEVHPVIAPVLAPGPALLPYLAPSPLFQSRSILVRDFLETYASPRLDAPGAADVVRTIQEVTRERLPHAADGKTLPLDVIRSGHGKRIGIERVFTTSLRCAGVPARFVEGLNLKSATRRKRVFWTEAWADGFWWPISASGGWSGRLPRAYVALTRDGQRVVTLEGSGTVTYAVQARPAPREGS